MPFVFVILYGLATGFFELVPISSSAHQQILSHIFGINTPLHLLNFILHLVMLCAVTVASMPALRVLSREYRYSTMQRSRRGGTRRLTYEFHFLRSAAAVTILSSVLLLLVGGGWSLFWVGIFLILNGIFILISEHLPMGNKAAKHLSTLDAIVFGAIGTLGIFSGISRVAAMFGYGTIRGIDRNKTCSWVITLSIPYLLIRLLLDLIGLVTFGAGPFSFLIFLAYLLASVFAFVTCCGAIATVRFIAARVGLSSFAYYSIGAGLFTFFLYLTV